MSVSQSIVIDAEFKSLIPPLDAEELAQLEENILKYGIRDPLVLWNETLLDGHNRYEIAARHNLPFDTFEIDLPNREAALDWIDRNQLGRRNLKPEMVSMIRGRIFNRIKAEQVEERTPEGHFVPVVQTAENIGKTMGVSGKTIKRDGKFAEAVNKIGEKKPEVKAAILNGTAQVTKAEVIDTISEKPSHCPNCLHRIKMGRPVIKDCEHCPKTKKQKPAKPRSDDCPHCGGTGRIG